MKGPGTTQLHLLRHADAGDPEAWDGPDDERPLSARGEGQAERLGRFLGATGFRPDAVLSSPKLRAAQTAEIVGRRLGVEVGTDVRLGGALDLAIVEAIIAAAGDPAIVVLVGHDPDFSELLSVLCGGAAIPMRKGALARVDAERPLVAGTGTLRWLVPPDLLKGRG